MVRQPIWIVIVIAVFFVGVGVSYAHFANTYDPMSMKFQNQQMFDQMMSNNPRMSQQWMDSGMMNPQQMMNDPQSMNQWMNTMMQNPQAIQQMHDMMMSNSQHMSQMMSPMMDTMMNDPDMQKQMMDMMINNQGMMSSMMNNQDMMDMMGSGMMNGNMMMGDNMMSQQMQKQNEDKQTETTSSSYVQMVDGIQIVTINAKEFKFIPSEIHINTGKTKFILVNDGVAEHELVVYDISKKDIVDKAELAEDEATIKKNILFEIEEVPSGESGETDVLNLQEGSYVMGCHVPGHYEAGMKGTLDIES